MTPTNPMLLNSTPPLEIITIIVHASAVGMCTSLNANFVTLTSFPKVLCLGHFKLMPTLAKNSSVLNSPLMVLPTDTSI